MEHKLNELELRLNKQQNIFQSLNELNEIAVKSSYELSYLISPNSKLLTDGQFIKECLTETAKIVSW
jgi:hypothetical protein